ncbi:MAG: hypothetical protein J7K75_09630 [Desulfuromonas sp.]|nr:hypothetical protein [Desulfuromonas sp.]
MDMLNQGTAITQQMLRIAKRRKAACKFFCCYAALWLFLTKTVLSSHHLNATEIKKPIFASFLAAFKKDVACRGETRTSTGNVAVEHCTVANPFKIKFKGFVLSSES